MAAPSAAAAAGAAAAALLQQQLFAEPRKSLGKSGGWTEHQTGDGRKFYFHEETSTSEWERPESLQDEKEKANDTDWKEYKIWDGRSFFYHPKTKVSCWNVPPEVRKARGEPSGIDERPLPMTEAEQQKAYWERMKSKGMNNNWTWSRANQVMQADPLSDVLSEEARKQCFAEFLSYSIMQKQVEARAKQRNAASALERLIEERFARPEDLETTYEEAKQYLEHEEAWNLVKSDLRRDECFQNVMERLEEKHTKERTEKRGERVVRLQRLLASDPQLKRVRLRWQDAKQILERRDELQEEEPPLEALRLWSSMRILKPAAEHEYEWKTREKPDPLGYREERQRRDRFVTCLRESVARGMLTEATTWSEFEPFVERDHRFLALQEGPGGTAQELFTQLQVELKEDGYAGVIGNIDVNLLGPAPTIVAEPMAKRQRHGFDPAPDAPAGESETVVKQELLQMKEEDASALDEFLAAATTGNAPTPVVKEEIQD